MKRIDADELKKAIDELFESGGYDSGLVMNTIDNAPTVEITEEQAIDKLHETGWLPLHDKEMTERPQGKWKIIANAFHQTKCKCSLCKHYIWIGEDKNFCPNCGAQMVRGGKE